MFTVNVGSDLYGKKHNVQLPFAARPSVREVVESAQAYFDVLSQSLRPAGYPDVVFQVESLQALRGSQWVVASVHDGVTPGQQMWCFQPENIWHSDASGIVPEAVHTVLYWRPLAWPARVAATGPAPTFGAKVLAVFAYLDTRITGRVSRQDVHASLTRLAAPPFVAVDTLLHAAGVPAGRADLNFAEFSALAETHQQLVDALYFRARCQQPPAPPPPALRQITNTARLAPFPERCSYSRSKSGSLGRTRDPPQAFNPDRFAGSPADGKRAGLNWGDLAVNVTRPAVDRRDGFADGGRGEEGLIGRLQAARDQALAAARELRELGCGEAADQQAKPARVSPVPPPLPLPPAPPEANSGRDPALSSSSAGTAAMQPTPVLRAARPDNFLESYAHSGNTAQPPGIDSKLDPSRTATPVLRAARPDNFLESHAPPVDDPQLDPPRAAAAAAARPDNFLSGARELYAHSGNAAQPPPGLDSKLNPPRTATPSNTPADFPLASGASHRPPQSGGADRRRSSAGAPELFASAVTVVCEPGARRPVETRSAACSVRSKSDVSLHSQVDRYVREREASPADSPRRGRGGSPLHTSPVRWGAGGEVHHHHYPPGLLVGEDEPSPGGVPAWDPTLDSNTQELLKKYKLHLENAEKLQKLWDLSNERVPPQSPEARRRPGAKLRGDDSQGHRQHSSNRNQTHDPSRHADRPGHLESRAPRRSNQPSGDGSTVRTGGDDGGGRAVNDSSTRSCGGGNAGMPGNDARAAHRPAGLAARGHPHVPDSTGGQRSSQNPSSGGPAQPNEALRAPRPDLRVSANADATSGASNRNSASGRDAQLRQDGYRDTAPHDQRASGTTGSGSAASSGHSVEGRLDGYRAPRDGGARPGYRQVAEQREIGDSSSSGPEPSSGRNLASFGWSPAASQDTLPLTSQPKTSRADRTHGTTLARISSNEFPWPIDSQMTPHNTIRL